MKLIDSLDFPRDIRKLSDKDTEIISDELREFLIESVSKTGGHLSSNLGVVDLTLSLFKAFDFEKDKIIKLSDMYINDFGEMLNKHL